MKNGFNNRNQYNQVANYVYMQSEINIKVGDKSPKDYFALIEDHSVSDKLKITGIANPDELLANLKQHCIPEDIMQMEVANYQDFLVERRKLMAQKIKSYYFSL